MEEAIPNWGVQDKHLRRGKAKGVTVPQKVLNHLAQHGLVTVKLKGKAGESQVSEGSKALHRILPLPKGLI